MVDEKEAASNGNYGPSEVQYKSEGEQRVATALMGYGIPFLYEHVAPALSERGKYLVPDFYVPSLDTYIEFYGRAGNADYDQRTVAKTHAYERLGLRVVAVYPWDLCHRTWPQNLYDAVRSARHSRGQPQGRLTAIVGGNHGYRRGRGY